VALKQDRNSSAVNPWPKRIALLVLAALLFTGYRKYEAWNLENLMDFYGIRENFPDPQERQFLHLVLEGDVDRVLAEAETVPGGINATGADGLTPLTIAVLHLDMPMVKELLKAGANPDGAKRRVPLGIAVQAYNLDYAKVLLAAGANPDGLPSASPPLAEAGLLNVRQAVDLLLASGAHVDAKDARGETAVITTAAANHVGMVNYLLDRGASVWTVTDLGHTVAGLAGRSCLEGRIYTSDVAECHRLLDRLQAAHYPMPPPSRQDMLRLVKEGNWPPKDAIGATP